MSGGILDVIERNLQEIGKSLLVSLPKPWTQTMKLRKGSRIKMAVSQQGNLLISPEFAAPAGPKETTMEYDEIFVRRFFRLYFAGNENITILLKSGAGRMGQKERKQIYSFLGKFMNVQVIEDSPSKIVVKCFKIDELSIEECLRRMFYLSLNMMEELGEGNDETKIQELEMNLTKFYYMLVMQIRRFLSEGKYTSQTSITLLDAMDYRMVAEKIERVGDVIKEFDSTGNDSRKLLEEVRETYRHAVENFMNHNYEKALDLFVSERAVIARYLKMLDKSRKAKDQASARQLRDMIKILNYSREISMLVR